MPRASEIYQGTKMNPPPQIYQEGVVKSTQAMRACSLFPKEQDLHNILDQSVNSGNNQAETHFTLISFENFMIDRAVTFTPELPVLAQIESYNTSLQEDVHKFNPTYEDKRLTRGHQPMSRRRQIEIELNMTRPNNRNGGADNGDHDPNFFVDAYSDEQIQEIISIFRNDFKPPKNLWIEKQPNSIGGGSGSQANSSQAALHAQAQSPDFFQDIYSEAIDQFNQHQTMMQQKQQDELQQQVSSGSSLNTSVSSIISSASGGSQNPAQDTVQGKTSDLERQDSSASNTPSPTLLDQDCQKTTIQIEKQDSSNLGKNSNGTPESPQIETQSKNLVVPIGPVGPTSPILVSQSSQQQYNQEISAQQKAANAEMRTKLLAQIDFDKFQHPSQPNQFIAKVVQPATTRSKPRLQMEQLDFKDVAIAAKKTKKMNYDKKDYLQNQVYNSKDLIKQQQNLNGLDQQCSAQQSSQLQYQQINEPMLALNLPQTQKNMIPPILADNDYFKETDQHVIHLKNHTHRAETKKDKLHTTNPGSNSTPDFSMIQKNQKSPKTAGAKLNHNETSISSGIGGGGSAQTGNLSHTLHQPLQHNNTHLTDSQAATAAVNASGFGHQSSRLNNTGTQGSSDEQRISRKMAQTYLSGLSQGYISNMDNLKLLNNCINSSQPHDSSNIDVSLCKGHGGSGKSKAKSTSMACANTTGAKLSTRTNTMLEGQLLIGAPSASNMFGSQQQQMSQTTKGHKKSTLTASPQVQSKTNTRKGHNKFKSVKNINKSSQDGSANYNKLLRDTTGINATHHANQSSNGLADLNYFIKTIEKDMSATLKNRQELNSMPNTPSNLIKKVGDQMKALCVDPKLWKQVENNQLRKQNQQVSTRHPPPEVKLLALNQIVKNDDSNCTPSNSGLNHGSKMHKTSSPYRQGGVSGSGGPRNSESEGCLGLPTNDGLTSKSARHHDKKSGNILSLGGTDSAGGQASNLASGAGRESHHLVKTHRNTHQDHGSARGVSNNSQGNHSQHQGSGLDKSLLSEKFTSKQHPVTTKAKDVSAFQFKKGSHTMTGAHGFSGGSSHGAKQNQKGFSALASKTHQLKRDQQSGGLVMTMAGGAGTQTLAGQQHNTKLNSSIGAINGVEKHGNAAKKTQKGNHGAHASAMTMGSGGFLNAKEKGITQNAVPGNSALSAKGMITELMNNNNIGGGAGSAGGGLCGGRGGEQLCANVVGGGLGIVDPITVRQPLTQRNSSHYQQQEQGDHQRQPQSPESANAATIGGKPPLRKKSGQSVKGSMMMVAKPPGLFIQQPSYY